MADLVTLSTHERRILKEFHDFLMKPGQMLCFDGQNLLRNRDALTQLTEKDLLVKESFPGGYSLTRAGFLHMKKCQ